MHSQNGAAASQRARVVLLGGKALAVEALQSMLAMPGIEVAAVVPCADDDPDAANWYPSLAREAMELGLSVHQTRSVNEPDAAAALRDLQPDLLLSIFYDKILKPHVLAVPAVAAINVHFGYLPYNRGSFPIPWAIIDGNDPGVTMHYMDPGVDTGDIVAQIAVPAAEFETARDVYDRCTKAGLQLVERYLPLVLAGSAPRRPQPGGGTYYRPGYPFDRWIDWSRGAECVGRFVRALSFAPYPAARATFAGREVEIVPPVWPREGDAGAPGTVLELQGGRVTAACGKGLLTIETISIDGERRPAAEGLRDVGCGEGDVLEGVPWVRNQAA
jgi:methionyl-tRNA formyltransferase